MVRKLESINCIVYCINEQQQEVNKVLFTSEVYCLQLRDKGQVGEITNKL